MSQNVVLVERKTCYHVANIFLTRLELIWLIFRLEKNKNVKKNAFLAKSSGSQWVKPHPGLNVMVVAADHVY